METKLRDEIAAEVVDAFIVPGRVYDLEAIQSKPCPIPAASGIYAWYFQGALPGVPIDGYAKLGDKTLLYIGVSPATDQSKNNLRKRIRAHYTSNASASTLRYTLGCLLSEKLGLTLRRVGRTKRFYFPDGEEKLSEWMARNAFVRWVEVERPWNVELQVIHQLAPPLNIQHNEKQRFSTKVSEARAKARETAKMLPVVMS